LNSDDPVWTVQLTKEEETRFWTGIYGAFAVAFAADEKRVFCGWAAGVAEIDRKTGKVIKTTKFPKLVSTSADLGPWLAFIPGSDECVYYGEDEQLVRFNFNTGKIHDKFNVHIPNKEIYHVYVALSPDGKRVLTYGGGTWNRYMAEWDLATGERCRLFDELERFRCATYSHDGEQIWVNTLLLDRRTGKWVEQPGVLAKYRGWLWPSPDGKHALGLPSGLREEERLDMIRLSDGKILREFSSNGLWYQRHRPGDPAYTLLEPRAGIVAFTPDGKTVMLTGTAGAQVELGFFDLETGKCTHKIRYDP
jgi:WD40 repeat protein